MYINTISFKNGRLVAFRSEIPFSVDKVAEGWNLVTDEKNKAIVSFRGSEIVTLVSEVERETAKPSALIKVPESKVKKNGKKPGLKTKITNE